MEFQEFKGMLLYRRVVDWKDNTITLDNGIVISIEETDQDCCASASGCFTNVKLEALITDVTEPKYMPWDDGDTYGCRAVVKMLHNQNLVCQANANADAGNGGYYFSVASFVVKIPNQDEQYVDFVSSSDKKYKKHRYTIE